MEIRSLIARAVAGETSLPPEALTVHGFATPAKRHLLHLLCAEPNTRYLEVGTWEGATFMPALFGNPSASGVGIDNFCVHGPGSRDHFLQYLRRLQLTTRGRLVEKDCWNVDLRTLQGPFTVYFFDGPHSVEDQRRAFTYYDPVLADSFIAIVDDWTWPEVQEGTRAAFAELRYEIEWEWDSGPQDAAPEWGSGFYVARVRHTRPRDSLVSTSRAVTGTPRVAIGIPTCVNPQGTQALLRSIEQHSPFGEYQVIVSLDGNDGWRRLDQMGQYAHRFNTIVMQDDPETDHQRIERNNPTVRDYQFLADLVSPTLHVTRNVERLGVTGHWNQLVTKLLATGCEYFLILNDDIEVGPRWLEYLLAAAAAYPNGMFFGFASGGTPGHPGPAWPGLRDENFWGPCMFLRAAHARAVLGARGWLFNPQFKLFYSDGWMIYDALHHGFDVVSIADPIPLRATWHRSLGHWVNLEAREDSAKHDGKLPDPHGRFFTYVRMNERFEVTAEKKL